MHPFLVVVIGISITLYVLFIHGFGMYLVMHRFELNWPNYDTARHEMLRQSFLFTLIALILFTHIIEVLFISLIFYGISAFPDLPTSFYYTGETYTTLGYGDVLLPKEWRQLALFISMSGLLSFGWSTGVLVNIVGKTFKAQISNLRK